MGKIRLKCMYCDRTDFDRIDQIPSDWRGVVEVCSYKGSLKREKSATRQWHTHIGTCPTCKEIYPPIPGLDE